MAKPKADAAVAAFVALWTSADDQADKVNLTALAANPRKGWDEATRDSADDAFDAKKFRKSTLAGLLADTIDTTLASSPDATHGPDCYILTVLKAALGARYEAGWENRIRAYAVASGWHDGALEDPSAPAPAPAEQPVADPPPGGGQLTQPLPGLGAPPPGGHVAAPGAVRALPGQPGAAAAAHVAAPPAPPPLFVNKARIARAFEKEAVQRFFATLLAAFARGDLATVDRMHQNLDQPVMGRVYGDDAIWTLRRYIVIRRGTDPTVRMTPAELHAAFGLNPP